LSKRPLERTEGNDDAIVNAAHSLDAPSNRLLIA
jgi:hypothetical protein